MNDPLNDLHQENYDGEDWEKAHRLVLLHYVGKTMHEVFVFAGELQVGHEDHLKHPLLLQDPLMGESNWVAAPCWATIAADIAIGLGLVLDERRVSEEEYAPYKTQWHLLDFSATTEWHNKGGYGTAPTGPE